MPVKTPSSPSPRSASSSLSSSGWLAPFVAVAVAFTISVGALDYSGPSRPGWSGGSPGSIGRFPAERRRRSCTSGTRDPTSPVEVRRTTSSRASTSSTQFFNTRIATVFHLGTETIGRDNLAAPALTVGDGGVVLDDRGRPFAPRYAVLDSRQPVGRRLARLDLADLGSQYQSGSSLTLWEVEPPLRFLVHAQPLPGADGREC